MPTLIPVVEITAYFPPVEEGADYLSEAVRLELKPDGRVAFPTGAQFDARELREALDLMLKGRNGQSQPFNPHPSGSVLLQPGQNYRGAMNIFTGGHEQTPADESS